MIELLTAATPNGHKVSIALEELGASYDVHEIDLGQLEQKQPWFEALNPNGRIPVIIDHDERDFVVFESGAILVYVAEKFDRLMPADAKGRSVVMQWLMFQMGGVGPMMGQANVFYRYLPDKIPLAIDRYQGECRRLFSVLDNRLRENEYLAGDYSIADIANYAWVRTHKWSGVDLDAFNHLSRWLAEIGGRPAVQAGLLKPPAKIDRDKGGEAAKQQFISMARTMVDVARPTETTTRAQGHGGAPSWRTDLVFKED